MKKNWIWLVILAVVVIGFVRYLNSKQTNQSLNLLFEESNTPIPATNTPTPKTAIKTPTSVPGAANYTQLITEYEGKRLQFDDQCKMTPVSPSFKNGTKIMLDNRSKSPRTITLNDQKYSLMGYGYQLVILSSKTLPQTINIDCDSQVNTGQILLQALISN